MLTNYSDIFKAELGTIMGFKAKLLSRSVPFAIKGAIEGKFNRLEAAGIMERVTQCD